MALYIDVFNSPYKASNRSRNYTLLLKKYVPLILTLQKFYRYFNLAISYKLWLYWKIRLPKFGKKNPKKKLFAGTYVALVKYKSS